ncbi:ABC transporter permease [Mesorhizobium sp. L2C067A000]|uniref:ABC transporter permease n=1 Tax=Mesorhizobium sp. L2C067A000 TaxID=1287106 RepID=UPI00067F1F7E|nr:ABC transporter permease [Mesorhizobium sp. L2C067A000]
MNSSERPSSIAALLRYLANPELKGVVLGVVMLSALCALGAVLVPGFFSESNIRSILLLAAFLGLAAMGQTFVALLGGLDLSIPFIIGSANVGLAALLGAGLSPVLAVILIVVAGAAVGLLNALLSFRLQNQALIVSLGVGFSLVGLSQVATSIGNAYGGNVMGAVPDLLSHISAANGTSFGLPIAPVVLIWIAATAVVAFLMKRSRIGRGFYAVGGNRIAAARLSYSAFRYWIYAYCLSGALAAGTGVLLLGFSGGGFVGVGDPYLFTTIAAVVLGGTSLLGGAGGPTQTVIGVLVLQVLTSLLVGLGFSFAAQQVAFGLMIVPMVAVYARTPPIRMQI